LLPKVLELTSQSRWDINKVAVVMDMREKMFFSELPAVLKRLKRRGEDYQIIFLDAADRVLIRRYKETRRLHPIRGEDLEAGIEAERGLLGEVKGMANRVIDTSSLNPHQLREVIFDYFKESLPDRRLNLTIVSFGYRYGTPSDAEIVMDVRFLPNPFFVEELKALSGLDPKVREFVLEKEETKEFLSRFVKLLHFLLPNYVKEGKSYLTVAVGCTGGMHRSVVIAEQLARTIAEDNTYNIKISHRDITKS
jgi:RNase adapter protein RapZ